MNDQESPLQKHKLSIFLFLAIISSLFLLFKIGIVLIFWLIIILWIILFLIFFIYKINIVTAYIWYFVGVVFIFTNLTAFGFIFSNNNSGYEKTADGIALANCTSNASDKPVMIEGWKSTIYSAALQSSTPGIKDANSINTFSYSGITNKTEKNSLYARIEKVDGSYITGYGTTMEACSEDNKTSLYYTAAQTTSLAGQNVVASIHYFHGGKYLHGEGNYRVDVYIKTPDGKWHLVDRMNGINITK